MPLGYYNQIYELRVTIAQMKLMRDNRNINMNDVCWKTFGMRLCNNYITLSNNIDLIKANYSNPPPDSDIVVLQTLVSLADAKAAQREAQR